MFLKKAVILKEMTSMDNKRNNTTNKKYTFWKLLEDFSIEIPIIQRDYAQGRETKKVKQIRKNFLDAILEAIEKPDKSKDLDFIYGYSEKNDKFIPLDGQQQQSVCENDHRQRLCGNDKFIPLDGQQRLTTLFLVHWYLASRSGKIGDSSVQGKLFKFTYETRISSRDFCKALVKNTIKKFDEKKFSDNIKDCTWFFLSWEKDPTIKSMLVMLDAIHEKFKNKDYGFLWKNLTTNSPITFQFLDMEKLTDDLYIKMNARGEPLTDFENFKAWFEQHILSEIGWADGNKADTWKELIDGDWTDLFWKYKDSNNKIDDQFMRFFNGMALNYYVASFNGRIDKNEDFKKNIQIFLNDTYIPMSKYIELKCFTKESVDEIFETLECLKGGKYLECLKGGKDKKYEEIIFFIKESSIFESFIGGKVTYPGRVLFYAMFQFLITIGDEIVNWDESTGKVFRQWMRVARNLIENSNINSPERFASAIRSICNFCGSGALIDVYDYLEKEKEIEFFVHYQIAEEQLKAKLINNDSKWEAKLLEVENHKYFAGQIGFLLNFSEKGDGYYDMSKFESYSKKAIKIFDQDKGLIKDKGFIFQRALLVEGDYLIEGRYSKNQSFCRYREEWRKFFREGHTDLLKRILEDMGKYPKKEDLEEIIENNFGKVNDWRKYFIKRPEILEYCKEKQIKRHSDTDIRLLWSLKQTYYKELYSYFFYLEYLEGEDFLPFKKSDHEDGYTTSKKSCAVLSNWEIDSSNYTIKIHFSDNEYKLCFIDRNNNGIDGGIQKILNNKGFQPDDGKFTKKFGENKEPEEIKNFLKGLCDLFR